MSTLPIQQSLRLELVQQFGARQFVAVAGHRAQRCLFVEQGEVIAQQQGSPRYSYGNFYKLTTPGDGDDHIESRIEHWIESGDAYQHYLV